MTFESMLFLFLGIVGVSCVFQAVVTFLIATRLSAGIDAMAGALTRMQRGLESVIRGAAAGLNLALPPAQFLRELNSQSSPLWKQARTQVEKAEREVDQTLQAGRRRLQEFDAEVDSLARRYQGAVARVQEAILQPWSEVAASTQRIGKAFGHWIRKH
ncbi:MAG: hypothetical protein HY315_08155 [Acidobacteria bacterium]|nr:hypothetical protein [Acidobacteriota bacterium]